MIRSPLVRPPVVACGALALGILLGGHVAFASDCTRTSTGMTPLIDFAPGQTYFGEPGGLYPGGANVRPAAHESAGLAIANAIVPLDTLGNPDPAGRIVLVSIGMSNATIEFSAFVPKSNADAQRNPRTIAIDCAEGGQATQDIRQPTAAYWDFVATRLRAQGSSPAQAQVVWLKEARRQPTEGFPAATDSLLADLGTIVRIIHQRLPNVRICYLTSRIYAGYATSLLNPEPYAYESGFAVKWLVAAQIGGVDSLNFDGSRGAVRAPWLSWGPYLWADGETPRSDGLTWSCSEFQSDGTHPNSTGANVVADSLLRFFHQDDTATPWYLRGVAAAPRANAEGGRLTVMPNPASIARGVRVQCPPGPASRLEIYDAAGRLAARIEVAASSGVRSATWDGHAASGVRPRAGLYWARLAGTRGHTPFVMMR